MGSVVPFPDEAPLPALTPENQTAPSLEQFQAAFVRRVADYRADPHADVAAGH